MKVRLITIKRPVEISSRKFLLKLFRIIELYRKMILLKQNIVNTKKSHKLIFLRNVKTTLLSFGCVKVLIIVIMRTFISLEFLFFKGSFFYTSILEFFYFSPSCVIFSFFIFQLSIFYIFHHTLFVFYIPLFFFFSSYFYFFLVD